jgi:tetratricopeptide (TPR) repeat protein
LNTPKVIPVSHPMKITRAKLFGVALAIFVGALWLYWPSVNGGFLTRMDDDEYLRQAVHWQGLSWGAVRWAFTSTEPYYQPLPRLSHVLDYQIWGTNAQGHHVTSVLVHAFNAVLVFGFLWTLLEVATSLSTRERFVLSIGVAAVFAIHPLQVESVAWMSGRTQLLCTAFGIGSLWAYVAGARRWMVWTFFVAALLCKPLAVSLPFAMLALDYWQHEKSGWRELLRRNAAMIAVGVAAAAMTIITESRVGGLLLPLQAIRPSERVLLTAQSLMFYPWKLMWPTGLSPYYPRPASISLFQPFVFVSMLSVVVVTALCVWRGRRALLLTAGWGTYVLFILPVSGLTATGGQAVADRYAYFAMLPLLILAGNGAIWFWRRCPMIGRYGLAALLIGELFFFGIRTRAQTLVWRNDETLWRGVLVQFPDSDQANEMLAQALLNENRVTEAIGFARHAVEVAPSAETYRNLGIALAQDGKTTEAIEEFNRALQLKPGMADTHFYLGIALARLNRVPEAIIEWKQTLRIDPDHAEAHANLGVALEGASKLEEAVGHYEQALRIRPDLAVVHYDLGNALVRLRRVPEAIRHYEEAVRLKPDYSEAQRALARLRATQ